MSLLRDISVSTPLPLGEGQGGGAACCCVVVLLCCCVVIMLLKKAATLSGDSFHSVITSAHVRERH